MINVIITENPQGKIIGYKVQGHSNIAPKGYDIVCAGISTLVQSVLSGLKDFLKLNLDYNTSAGNFYVRLKTRPNDCTETLLRTMTLMLKEFERQYSKIIKIEFE